MHFFFWYAILGHNHIYTWYLNFFFYNCTSFSHVTNSVRTRFIKHNLNLNFIMVLKKENSYHPKQINCGCWLHMSSGVVSYCAMSESLSLYSQEKNNIKICPASLIKWVYANFWKTLVRHFRNLYKSVSSIRSLTAFNKEVEVIEILQLYYSGYNHIHYKSLGQSSRQNYNNDIDTLINNILKRKIFNNFCSLIEVFFQFSRNMFWESC